MKREYELEGPVALVVEKYATFIDSSPDHVDNSPLKMLLWKNKHFMNWRKQQQQAVRKEVPITGTQKITSKSMMQRILNSKNLVAFVLAAATGMTLYFRVPFPEANIFLRVMALRSPSAFEVLKYSCTLFLFSTPYIGYSVLFSGLYIFALKAKQQIRAGKLPLFPDPQKRDDLFLVLGEVHNPRKQAPAECPLWLVIPGKGLFTGVSILGAIGSADLQSCDRDITYANNPATRSEERKRLR